MKILLCLISFIFMTKITTTSNPKGPGASACCYSGDTDIDCKYDGSVLEIIPDSCTSFVFYGLTVDGCYEVSSMNNATENDALLDKLHKRGKKVYAYYGRPGYEDWISVLSGLAYNDTNALDESKGIKAFMEKHPGITGLMLFGLGPYQDAKEFVGFTEYLQKYIEILKKETGLEIGFIIHTYKFYEYYGDPTAPWLNFTALNSCIDFYLCSLYSFFNDCTETMRNGVYPLSGSALYTLENIKSTIANKACIPTDKLYYMYPLLPKSSKDENYCVVNNERLCKFPDESKSWCSDTQETLFKKGQWFKNNAVGFVGDFINTDDPHGCCGCGPFPAYNAILAGFNGSASAPSCPLFDRVL